MAGKWNQNEFRATLPERDALIISRKYAGQTAYQIAEEFGITPARVWQILAEHAARQEGPEVDNER